MEFAGMGGASWVALGAAVVSALALAALHGLSPEFGPSWRMVSEYAHGRHGWVLAVMFLTWALATGALALAVAPLWQTGWLGMLGLVFMALAVVGQAMGGIFDIDHRLHGAAFMIGVPAMVVAAVLVTLALRRAGVGVPLWAGFLPLAGTLALGLSMMMLFSAVKAAGIDMAAQTGPLAALPEGVTAWNGWANRALVFGHQLWLALAAWAVLSAA